MLHCGCQVTYKRQKVHREDYSLFQFFSKKRDSHSSSRQNKIQSLTIKDTKCKILVIKYPKTPCTVWYVSCSCAFMLYQKFPRICKSREITSLKCFTFMLFHFLNFSQCVVSMFGIKMIYKVTNIKVHSKGRYFVFFKSLFKNENARLVWTTKLFSCICDITKIIPPTEIWMVGGGVERLVELCILQYRNPVQVFLYHCISDGNQLFSENFGCHFHFILHMSDKAAFVSWSLICVQRYRGNFELSCSNSASRWQRRNLHIYAAGHK